MKKKFFIVILVIIFFLVMLAFCLWSGVCFNQKKPINVGVLLPLSGPTSKDMKNILKSLRMSVQEANDLSGIDGHRFKLIIRDNKSDIKENQKLFVAIEHKYHPLFFISCYSYLTKSIAELAEKNKTPLFGFIVSSENVTRGRQYVYKYYSSSFDNTKVILSLMKRMAIQAATIFVVNDEFGRASLANIKKIAEEENISSTVLKFSVKTRDFSSLILAHKNSPAFYMVGFIDNSIEFLKQVRALHYSGKLFFTSVGALPQIANNPLANGIYFSAPSIDHPRNLYAKNVKRKYIRRYGKGFDYYTATTYDLFKIIYNLMKKVDVKTRQQLTHVMNQGFVHNGIFGVITVAPNAHDFNFPVFPVTIRKNRLVYL